MKERMKIKINNLLYNYPYLKRKIVYYNFLIQKELQYMLKLCKILLKKIYNSNNKLPFELQLPITYKCNLDCVMCGMHNMITKKGFTVCELDQILKNKLFSEIKSVGINGGEPFLVDLEEYVRIIIKNLYNLTNIYIISNGFLTDRMIDLLPSIYSLCKNNKIKLHLSISVDGIGAVHDEMRGRKRAFENVEKTCLEINKNLSKYASTFQCICTITRINIDHLNEVQYWAQVNKINISYNIATVHKRLYNHNRYDKFSVLSDELSRGKAAEFFYGLFTKDLDEKYYVIFRYLLDGYRISDCAYQRSYGVTLTPNANISYCATHSKDIGCVLEEDALKIFNDNLNYRSNLVKKYCTECSHYAGSVNLKYYKEYLRDCLKIIGKPYEFR